MLRGFQNFRVQNAVYPRVAHLTFSTNNVMLDEKGGVVSKDMFDNMSRNCQGHLMDFTFTGFHPSNEEEKFYFCRGRRKKHYSFFGV